MAADRAHGPVALIDRRAGTRARIVGASNLDGELLVHVADGPADSDSHLYPAEVKRVYRRAGARRLRIEMTETHEFVIDEAALRRYGGEEYTDRELADLAVSWTYEGDRRSLEDQFSASDGAESGGWVEAVVEEQCPRHPYHWTDTTSKYPMTCNACRLESVDAC